MVAAHNSLVNDAGETTGAGSTASNGTSGSDTAVEPSSIIMMWSVASANS
jgi:hypothetical protein